MRHLCLVTGANGHLGNTLVRALLDQGYRVRAGVRDMNNTAPFDGLDCEMVYAELLDESAMLEALRGVDVLFQVPPCSSTGREIRKPRLSNLT